MLDKIREAVRIYEKQKETNVMPDGSMRWEYYGVQLRVAQAAVSYGGYIVTGTRHFCPIMCMQINAVGGEEVLVEFAGGHKNVIQGFTDQYGRFLTREEAYVIAKEAGQITRGDYTPGVLYSECYI